MIFERYSSYYDLLYRDKDYPGEVAFVDGLIRRHVPQARSVLELGSGTGLHASLLAERGYRVHGVERSEEMLGRARQRQSALPQAVAARLRFAEGDVRDIRLDGSFDCVLSLFHVVSYQPADADLSAMFATVRTHLREGGVFIFDCWYGPAVLFEQPEVRVKRVEDDAIRVIRIAEPVMHSDDCLVDVEYTVFIEERASGRVEQLRESHRMRYLFLPEIRALLSAAGMRLVHACEWMSGSRLSLQTWSACIVAQVA